MTQELKLCDVVEIKGRLYMLSDYPPAYIEFMHSEHGDGFFRDRIEEDEVTPDKAPIEVWNFNWSQAYFFPGNGIANAGKGGIGCHPLGITSGYHVEFHRDDTASWWISELEECDEPYAKINWCLANARGPWLLQHSDYYNDDQISIAFFNKNDEMLWKLTWQGVEGGAA